MLKAGEILLTADTEGHVTPCQTCPSHAGQGGMARRATLVHQLRSDPRFADGALLDAGNALFGADSIDSNGQIIVAAYNALGYDAINISYRDFRFGKDQTLAAVKQAKFPVLSANLLDASTNTPLFAPYCVLKRPNARWGVIGLTERPAGMDFLPHLKRQLAGVSIQPPADALSQWLPKAKAESDHVILLYYGSATGLAPLRDKFGNQLDAILVGGLRPEEIPAGTTPMILGAEEHGKSIGRLTLASGSAAKVEQVAVTPDTAADPAMEKMLATYTPAPPPLAPAHAPAPKPVDQTASSESSGTSPQPAQPPPAGRSPFGGLGGGLLGRGGKPSPPPPGNTVPSTPAAASSAPPPGAPPANPPQQVAMTPPQNSPAPAPAASQPVVAPRVAAHQNRTPKGLAGVGLSADQVNQAIERGRDFLWDHLHAQLQKEHRRLGQDTGYDLLQALALVHAGAHLKYKQFDQELRGMLSRIDPATNPLATYPCGIACMLIEDYGDPVFYPKLRLLTRSLVEQQLPGGTWDYGYPVDASAFQDAKAAAAMTVEGSALGLSEAMRRNSPWSTRNPGDNSTSQFALLGLRAAARARIGIEQDVWQRHLTLCRKRHCADGSWGYTDETAGYGSMTCAGVCAIAIDRHQLGEKDPVDDPDLERGLAWLDSHFSATSNPLKGGYLYYYLYSLERVGRILDTEFIGEHEWYPPGAQFLVSSQRPDGSWLELPDTDPRCPTSFALLFLTRATQTLNVEVKHGGEGRLETIVATPPPARLYVILDASGSMMDQMDGREKFDIARDAVSSMFAALPDSAEVALRVYGHRKRSIEKDSDQDTALEYPMGPLDRPKLAKLLRSLRPRGKTPLALSLTLARQDLASIANQPVTLVLLTDGGEDTMPRRDPVKAAAELKSMSAVTFHIIGFDINQSDWGEQLRQMTAASNGRYWPAARTPALMHNLQAAIFGIPEDFTLYDDTAREVGRGAFGESRMLKEGNYQLKTSYGGTPSEVKFAIGTEQTTAVVFDASRLPRGSTIAPDPSQTQSVTQPSSSAHHFCTRCGKPLPPGAKFCPSCGQKVE